MPGKPGQEQLHLRPAFAAGTGGIPVVKLFCNRLRVISAPELFAYATRHASRFRLELCPCKELGKLVARVIALSKQREEERLGVLVDDGASDYFVAAWSDGALRGKLQRMLLPIKGRSEFVLRDDLVLYLFQGDAVTVAEASQAAPFPRMNSGRSTDK